MRIIAGKHKNRVITTSKKFTYRPTTNKFRQALFSILNSPEFADEFPMSEAIVLDVYAGSGIIAFEAISRGAKLVTLIDNNKDHLKVAAEFAQKIGEAGKTSFLTLDALSLPKAKQQYNIIFIDPPYYNNMATLTIASLIKQGWLATKALIAVELAKTEDFEIPRELELIKKKIYGNNKLLILTYE
ncbi:MAG: 16S rRNA (guanine(966)-N(2))-methyltransferase RsmD [Rickettsiaceae bacterium]|nr:16S rRNA (guanine(966)-N(2))-methyltransferase RsmD [Rickettsiaceae bacterium]